MTATTTPPTKAALEAVATKPTATIECYASGKEPLAVTPGDFILTHGHGLGSWLIRFGQAIRIHGDDRKCTYWNHAALVVSEQGDLVEAIAHRGVVRSHLSDYRPRDYAVARPDREIGREYAVAFANGRVGLRYGSLTILSIVLTLLTGAKLSFYVTDQYICSQLVARALERLGYGFVRPPEHIAPADLAKIFNVEP